MMRRITSLLLALMMVLCILPTASAADYSGYCGGEGDGTNLTWELDTATGTLTISGTGVMMDYMYNYVDNRNPWYAYREQIKAVTIADTVTYIGKYAFCECTALRSVTIPESVTTIGKYAFYNCDALETVTIGDGVTLIDEGVFYDCDALTSMTIGDNVKTIGYRAFYDCRGLVSVTIPDSVTTIGERAFEYCSNITAVYYKGTQEQWRKISVAYGNDALYSAELFIEKEVPTDADGYCGGEGDGTNLTWKLDDEGTLTISGTGPMADYWIPLSGPGAIPSPWDNTIKKVVIDDGVTTIGSQAFQGCGILTSVSIPATLTSIGSYAFAECSALTDVYYYGTEEQWEEISVGSTGNEYLLCARCHYIDLIYLPEQNDTHSYTRVCSDCDETVGTVAFENCIDEDNNRVCDYCEQILSCDHQETTKHYTSNDDGRTHKVTVACDACKNVLYTDQMKQSCTDVDGFCCLCGQNMSCRHTETEAEIVYADNGDGTHDVAVCVTCTGCGEEISRKQTDEAKPCIDDVLDFICDCCKANLPRPEILSGTCGENLTWTINTTTGELVISGTGEMTGRTADGRNIVKTVVIEEGVTSIEMSAFYRYAKLTTVTIPSSMKAIGEASFIYCNNLKDVYFRGTQEQWDAIQIASGAGLKEDILRFGVPVVTFSIPGCAPNLESELEMGIAIPKDAIPEDVEFTAIVKQTSAGEAVKTFEIPQSEWKNYNAANYMVYVKLAAKCMADEFSIEVTDEYGNVWNEPFSCSYRSYVAKKFDQTTDPVRKALLVDMLNYGAAAQERFGYNTGDLANKDLTEEQQAYSLAGTVNLSNKQVLGTNNIGTSVSLDSQILVYSYFKGIADPTGMYAVVEIVDSRGVEKTLHIDGADFELYNKSQQAYKICVDNLVPADVDVTYTMTVCNADGSVFGTAVDGLGSYLARQASGSVDPVFDAVATFCMAAKQYFIK